MALTTEGIKNGIGRHIGKKVVVRANKGRKKTVTKIGTIEAIYPSIFIVRFDSEDDISTRVSYSYGDVLTSTVQIKLARN